ncbi:efflux RND transporter periplasmic adaptor subunit [Patescibacteria group bacterium]
MIAFLKKHKFFIIIVAVIALIGWRFWVSDANPLTAATNAEDKYTVKKNNLKLTRTLTGEIDADEKVNLRFQTSGRLNWVGVEIGDMVEKYQTIASLDQRELKKNLDIKLLSYMNERWDFEQTREDYEDVMLTDAIKKVKEKSQFDLDDSVLDVELQSISLEYSNLWTPISGIVTNIEAPNPGINITPATAEFDIVNPDSVYLSVSADQNEVVGLDKDMEVELIFDSYIDETIIGKVDSISFTPKTGESSAVYEVKVKFPVDNSDFKYRIEMTADASFVVESKKSVLSVPTKAIKSDEKKDYVFMDKNGKKEKVYIKLGTEFDDDTEVSSGLNEGDVIYD